ncbi:MAG: rhodanese-like domain-containing protein [Planctomycetota bacterium]|jgi:rhodanese-related sulfurtransferase
MKLDGLVFVLGTLLGIGVFSETEPFFTDFWHNAGFLGRFTIPEWLGVPTGVIVLAVVVMAIGAFRVAQWSEKRFAKDGEPQPTAGWHRRAAAALVVLAVAGLVVGQPTVEDRVAWQSAETDKQLAKRAVQIDPGELLELMNNNRVRVAVLDTRDEAAFNLFHLVDARRLDPRPDRDSWAMKLPAEDVKVVVAEDEQQAAATWRRLVALGLINVYLLDGGMPGWIDAYHGKQPFPAALGARHPASNPDPDKVTKRGFERKVKVRKPSAAAGKGCG